MGRTRRLLRCRAIGPFSRLAVGLCGDPTCRLHVHIYGTYMAYHGGLEGLLAGHHSYINMTLVSNWNKELLY